MRLTENEIDKKMTEQRWGSTEIFTPKFFDRDGGCHGLDEDVDYVFYSSHDCEDFN